MSARIAVVGDLDPKNRTHAMTSASLDHVRLAFEWVPTDALGASDAAARLAGFDGVWIAPASPYRSELPRHPFFVASLFLPQARSSAEAPHPLLVGFAAAARSFAEARRTPARLRGDA